MKILKTFENFPGSGLPDDYQSKTGDMSGEHKHRHTHSEESKVYTKEDLERAFDAGSDMKDCESEFDFNHRGYKPFSSFDEWYEKHILKNNIQV